MRFVNMGPGPVHVTFGDDKNPPVATGGDPVLMPVLTPEEWQSRASALFRDMLIHDAYERALDGTSRFEVWHREAEELLARQP